MKISSTPWINAKCGCIHDARGNTVCHSFVHCDEMRGNRALIAETSAVVHETSLTPRQLAEQRAELLEALDELTLVIGLTPISGNKDVLQESLDKARSAIAKAEGGQP